jgi:hypothetical protein
MLGNDTVGTFPRRQIQATKKSCWIRYFICVLCLIKRESLVLPYIPKFSQVTTRWSLSRGNKELLEASFSIPVESYQRRISDRVLPELLILMETSVWNSNRRSPGYKSNMLPPSKFSQTEVNYYRVRRGDERTWWQEKDWKNGVEACFKSLSQLVPAMTDENHVRTHDTKSTAETRIRTSQCKSVVLRLQQISVLIYLWRWPLTSN